MNSRQTRYNKPDKKCRTERPGDFCLVGILVVLFFGIVPARPPLNDSLPITGYYKQADRDLSRRSLEKMLRGSSSDTVRDYAGRSRTLRFCSGGIGAAVWGVNIGISAYQISYLVRAIENNEPVTMPLAGFAAPLAIGGEIAGLAQGILGTRSDFLMYKAARAHNQLLLQRTRPDSSISLRIEKLRGGWYQQDKLTMPEHILYLTLRENEPSRPAASWSIFFREAAQPAYTVGGILLFYALMGFVEPQGVPVERRNMQLGFGIGVSAFGFALTTISDIFRSRAIDAYNRTDPRREEVPGIKEDE